jgi:hypothetical protein
VVDIFDEVEEDLRAERAEKLARKYGWVAMLAAILVIAGVSGWKLHEYRAARQDVAVATQYIGIMNNIDQGPAILKAGRVAMAQPLEQLANVAPEGYRTLSRLRAAGLLADAGDIQGAVNLYNAVVTDTQADPILRDLATLLSTGWQIDKGDPQMLAARIGPLALPDSPWAPLAQEQLALLDLRQGKTDDARSKLKALAANVLAPAGVRARATALLQGLG